MTDFRVSALYPECRRLVTKNAHNVERDTLLQNAIGWDRLDGYRETNRAGSWDARQQLTAPSG